MRRIHFFEILDQTWCPKALREGATDALEAITSAADIYRSVRDRMIAAIRITGAKRVVDLCSGGGGPWLSEAWLSEACLREPGPSAAWHTGAGQSVSEQDKTLRVALTDKFPSQALAARVGQSRGICSAVDRPVDATSVPEELAGFRTIFSSFHHFPDPLAGRILADAVRRGEGLASAEVTSRSARAVVTMFLLPLFVWWLTPRMRPFRWSRLFFTYLIPAIPFIILWDGVVSCLRTRTPEELLALTRLLPQYEWTAGYARGPGVWLSPVYLIGLPRGLSEAPRSASDSSAFVQGSVRGSVWR